MFGSVMCAISWVIIILICLRGEKMRDEYEEMCIATTSGKIKDIPIYSFEFKKPNIIKERKCNIDFHNYIIQA